MSLNRQYALPWLDKSLCHLMESLRQIRASSTCPNIKTTMWSTKALTDLYETLCQHNIFQAASDANVTVAGPSGAQEAPVLH